MSVYIRSCLTELSNQFKSQLVFIMHSNYDFVTDPETDIQLPVDKVISMGEKKYTQSRIDQINNVANSRCFHTNIMLEQIYYQGNLNAIFRTCENLGFANVNIVMNEEQKRGGRSAMGAHKWLNINEYETSKSCLTELKSQGYKILATAVDGDAIPISEWDFTQPTTIVFGNEKDGVSKEVLELADAKCIIPSHGFTESYNVSVAAAIIMYEAYNQRNRINGQLADVNQEQIEWLKANYYYRCAKNKELFGMMVKHVDKF